MFALHLSQENVDGRFVLGGYDEGSVETIKKQLEEEMIDETKRAPWNFMPSISSGIHWLKITSE